MKVLIYGAGAIGIAIGTFLIESGADVDYIASEKTYKEIKEDGIHRRGIFKDADISKDKVNAFKRISDCKENSYDYVLISIKTTANEEVSLELGHNKNVLKESGKIVIMQNGWGNDLPYRRFFSKEQIYSARVITGFERSKRNTSKVTVHAAPLIIGSLYGCDLEPVKPLVDILNKAGMESKASNDVGKALWAKMLYNCPLNTLGAVLGVNYGKLSESENAKNIMNKIIDEVFNTMVSCGYTTYYKSAEEYKKEFYEKLIPSTYEHRASTLQDMEKGIKTEIDSLLGIIIKLGREHNISVSNCEVIYNIIKAMEFTR